MQEAFLHFIWQYQKFNSENLLTEGGDPLIIFNKGQHNTDSGPDFKEARIKIGEIEWMGAVEIHLKASDWLKHRHQHDHNYRNVVLHVVWEADQEIKHMTDGVSIPTLLLKNKVDAALINQYESVINAQAVIPCAHFWPEVNSLTKYQMLEAAVIERLYEKSTKATQFQQRTQGDWEETTYFMLLSALGFKVNSTVFERLAELLSYSLLRKYKTKAVSVQALIYGVAGFLTDEFDDDYRKQLKEEWKFLKHKHHLDNQLDRHNWKFLRLRPANFPTVRLAQLSELICSMDSLFTSFVKDFNIIALKKSLAVKAKDYWNDGEKTKLGATSIESVMLNVTPPLLALYSRSVDESKYMDLALDTLEQLKGENNAITRKYIELGEDIKTAFDSQAYIQLHNKYCGERRCLSCKIGVSIMSSAK